jgi:hypothetical protein
MTISQTPSRQSLQASSCVDHEESRDKSRVRELMREVRTAAETAAALSRRSNDSLYRGLVDAARLAELMQRDDEAWRIFASDSLQNAPCADRCTARCNSLHVQRHWLRRAAEGKFLHASSPVFPRSTRRAAGRPPRGNQKSGRSLEGGQTVCGISTEAESKHQTHRRDLTQ